MKQYQAALSDYEEIVRLSPDSALAWNNLAWHLATCPDELVRDGKRAVAAATRACELTAWKTTYYFDTLASAYAEAGDLDSAVKWQAKAIDGLPPESKEREGFLNRLELYRKQKPYRDEPAAGDTAK